VPQIQQESLQNFISVETINVNKINSNQLTFKNGDFNVSFIGNLTFREF